MAKKSQINRNAKREKMVARYATKRAELKRVHHRCELSGRPKAYYRKLKLSRIALREMANFGQIPGMTKASW